MGKFNFKNDQDFDEVVKKAEEFYASIGEIRSPYFGDKITFNAAGLKQIESGRRFFWSIIPYWKIDSVNSRRVLHSGNPEHD